MPPKKSHLIRAAQIKPFVETAKRLGVPVKHLAHESGLPIEAVERGEGVIGEAAAWRFVERASQYPNCEHLGYLTALDHPVTHPAQLGGMEITLADSLREILEVFCQEVIGESDSCKYRLVEQSNRIWFTRELVITDVSDGWQPEQYVLTFIIQIVRLCAPGNWLPKKIRIATRGAPVVLPAEWYAIDFEWGWHRTEMLLEADVLKCGPRLVDDQYLALPKTSKAGRDAMAVQDLVDRQIWSNQMGLEVAARELGMSPATLKRRLDALHTRYSAILSKRRLHHAVRLLEHSHLSIREIAASLGYSAVSNFSRAFRKAQGMSPRQWRSAQSDPK